MPYWTSLLQGLTGGSNRVLEALQRVDGDRATVWVQLEGGAARFRSRLLLKDNQVVLSKPDNLRVPLAAGKFVRFRLPDDPGLELRMEIFAPQVNLAAGNSVFLCRLPTEGPAKAKRQSDRHGVGHVTNIRLMMPRKEREFRLSDISLTGCRVVATSSEAKVYFPLGRALEAVHLQVGTNAKVELREVVPRSYRSGFVGCEFDVKGEGTSQVYLERLIQTLEKQ